MAFTIGTQSSTNQNTGETQLGTNSGASSTSTTQIVNQPNSSGYVELIGVNSDNTNIVVGTVAKSREINVKNYNISINSYGEIVFKWLISDPSNLIDHFLILCKFQGITAPLGVIARLNNVNNYEFIDQETSPYVGSRQYFVNTVLKSGNIIRFDKSITYNRTENLPIKFTIPLDVSGINKNLGLRNKTDTIGDILNEPIMKALTKPTLTNLNSTTPSPTSMGIKSMSLQTKLK